MAGEKVDELTMWLQEFETELVRLGFDGEAAKATTRLLGYLIGVVVLTGDEVERWNEAGVMDGGTVLFGVDESERDFVVWLLFGLCWLGEVRRFMENGVAYYVIRKDSLVKVLSMLMEEDEEN